MDAVCEGDVGHLSEGLTKGTKAHIDSCLTSKAETALDYLIANWCRPLRASLHWLTCCALSQGNRSFDRPFILGAALHTLC